ncbi:substrate-binding domain-containing protein [Pseudonocardia oroxyli]|uniref:Monosaccharide ABC transporter substrate-binding protein, CUT2 family n=1 Tax=Pseudonocardia oroxyli TaxID=366584 RepID=A0A1G7SU04_PSEOR|nr:substrate-binding domain-containing protein [Pseudonocardia oroxyli]SDG26503.1 monosaccharide ABC transporter substrate-binding protein, CUT2 family [Pseudonocardia oroxyli]
MRFRIATATAVLAMGALVSTACSSGTVSGTSSTTAGANGCVSGPVKVGIIPKLGTDPYMVTVKNAAEAAAAASGNSDVIYTSPSDASGAAQIPFVNQLISQGVNAIMISGSDVNSTSAALKKAQDAGIKVVSFDSDVASGSRGFFVNQADTSLIGAQMLTAMGDMIDHEGDFAVLSSTQTAVNQNAWIDTIRATLSSDPRYAKMNLVTVAYGEEKADVNSQKALELVRAYPDLKGIIVPAGIGLPAAAEALSKNGYLGKVKLSGLAPVSLVKQYIATGNVQDVWWNVPDLGTLAYHTAVQYAKCQIEPKDGAKYSVPGLGEFTVGADGQVLLGPPTIVTPQNTDSFPF